MKFRHILLLAVVLFIFILRWRPQRFLDSPRPANPSSPGRVRITQFYSAAFRVPLGEKTVLCYGVDNAKTVQLTPAIDEIWPAVARCIDVAPTHTTQYTLTAAHANGETVSQSVTVEVGPARPKILEVSVNKLEITRGEPVLLCFKARNASAYDVGGLRPAMTPKGPMVNTPEFGCFNDRPGKTKTYMVKVTGPGGADSESVTVKVN